MKLRRYTARGPRRPVPFDDFTEELHYHIMSDADQLLRLLHQRTPAFLLKLFHSFRKQKYTARGEVVFVESAILHHHLLDMGLHRVLNDSNRGRTIKKMKELLFDDMSEFRESAREKLVEYDEIIGEYPAFCLTSPYKRILVPPAFHVFAVRIEELVNHSPCLVEFTLCQGTNRADLFSFGRYLDAVELRNE